MLSADETAKFVEAFLKVEADQRRSPDPDGRPEFFVVSPAANQPKAGVPDRRKGAPSIVTAAPSQEAQFEGEAAGLSGIAQLDDIQRRAVLNSVASGAVTVDEAMGLLEAFLEVESHGAVATHHQRPTSQGLTAPSSAALPLQGPPCPPGRSAGAPVLAAEGRRWSASAEELNMDDLLLLEEEQRVAVMMTVKRGEATVAEAMQLVHQLLAVTRRARREAEEELGPGGWSEAGHPTPCVDNAPSDRPDSVPGVGGAAPLTTTEPPVGGGTVTALTHLLVRPRGGMDVFDASTVAESSVRPCVEPVYAVPDRSRHPSTSIADETPALPSRRYSADTVRRLSTDSSATVGSQGSRAEQHAAGARRSSAPSCSPNPLAQAASAAAATHGNPFALGIGVVSASVDRKRAATAEPLASNPFAALHTQPADKPRLPPTNPFAALDGGTSTDGEVVASVAPTSGLSATNPFRDCA